MIKVSIDLTPQQIEEAFEKLPTREKLRLVKTFERKTRKERWDDMFKNIDKRRKKSKMPLKEIQQEVEKARKEFYARPR